MVNAEEGGNRLGRGGREGGRSVCGCVLRREETGEGGGGRREEGRSRREGVREGGGKLGREWRNGHRKRIMRKRESKTIRI